MKANVRTDFMSSDLSIYKYSFLHRKYGYTTYCWINRTFTLYNYYNFETNMRNRNTPDYKILALFDFLTVII